MPESEATLSGQCYCGALEFKATTPKPEVIHCHCKGCRDWTGGIAYSAVPCSFVEFVKGTPKEFQRNGGPTKVFCGDCGTGICNKVNFGPFTATVAAGILNESTSLKTSMHCQLAGKVPWADTSADGIPTFKGFPTPGAV
eukprot:CAMPEP_0177155172 /NCGR_PEP_ID=MMETSP0367-20130122/2024_1 /TAXON_ID=447022 ORGANISM="Scrippsiella hangoei-like, Strain SHHI-4" /NCGR_SAMPLE_ID=MMETSP0367 /ASSEMBLY_ACC=CAM_ASM_000362 /LENGTH=139 /DNA_ID=CAMNT_0018600487 /DNA_START=50 /DNA_END=469 /DNA_ORIENTATION=-